MKRGLNLLQSKPSFAEDNRLSSLLGFELPVTLKHFYSVYELGENCFQNAKRQFDGILIEITSVEFKKPGLIDCLGISHFYDIEDLGERWAEDVQFSELYLSKGLLPIAYTSSNLDHVFTDVKQDGSIHYQQDEEVILLARNIFDFCQQLSETDILDEDMTGRRVYRNWEDGFWRCASDKLK